MLERMGPSKGTAQEVFSWSVMDRTRKGGTISSLTATGAATITFEVTEYDRAGGNLGYAIVGDLFRFAGGAMGRVTAVADSTVLTDKQKVTVTKVGTGATWAVGDLADGEKFGHIANTFGEASSAPDGRLYLPTEDYNVLSILRRSLKISGTEFTNRTKLKDGKSWYFTQEDLEMKEFRRDQEGLLMFGVLDGGAADVTPASGARQTKGLITYALNEGTNTIFAGSVVESDLQDHITEMLIEGVGNEIYVFAGAQFLKNVQQALAPYAIQGAINYGALGKNTAGLDFVSYKFMGKTIHFAHYIVFEDQEMLPSVTATDADINFSNFSLWIDFGTQLDGVKPIQLRHKELNGENRKFVHAYEVGMVNPSGKSGGMVANGNDYFEIHYLSHIGLEVRHANRLGVLREGTNATYPA